MVDLPTAADIEKLPESAKAKIARASRNKGSGYERDVAKKIAGYFGYQWGDAFIRTKPHGHSQPEGDLKLINEVGMAWRSAELGPIECKNRREWAFDQFFKNIKKSKVYGYWTKSNTDTKKDNSIVIFTKAGIPDLVFYQYTGNPNALHQKTTYMTLYVDDDLFIVQTLMSFLQLNFPDPKSVL